MRTRGYTYCVIRYSHDPAAGEMMNVGVLLYAPETGFLGVKLEERYKRLSEAFTGFDGDLYRRALRQFEGAVDRISAELRDVLPGMGPGFSDAGEVARRIWPDMDMSYRVGPVLAGVTADPAAEILVIFDRMVALQYDWSVIGHRTDDEVWSTCQRKTPIPVRAALREKMVETADFSYRFEHAFRNERWHAVQPISLDYARPESIQEKATRWLGRGTALEGHPELGKLYLVLGRPRNEAFDSAYLRAKNLLARIPVDREFVEEDDWEDFSRWLESYMKEHGVIG